MFTGSGVNIKMLDFLAAGLPTITTPVGARGILNPGGACFLVEEAATFGASLRRVLGDSTLRQGLAERGRKLAEEHYDWRRISRAVGELMVDLAGRRDEADVEDGDAAPYFSVVIPTYQRPEMLRKLLGLLEAQTFRSFE
jgi:hypothetical protein